MPKKQTKLSSMLVFEVMMISYLHLIIGERKKHEKSFFQSLLKGLTSFMYCENPSSPNLRSVYLIHEVIYVSSLMMLTSNDFHGVGKNLLKTELHI